jgi:hypothetical protein
MDERPERPAPTGPVRRGRARDFEPDPDDDPPLPPVVRIAPRDRVPVVLAVALLAFVAVAVVKPWPSGPPSIGLGPVRPVASETPAPSPTPDPLADLRRQCEEPLGWRVYTIEDWSGRTLRAWRSLEPATAASGPLDPSIPIVPLGPVIEAVGYCSPWDGAERPPAASLVAAWSVPDPARGGEPEALPVTSIAPNPPSVLGALFAPPPASPAVRRPPAGGGPTIRPEATMEPAAAARWPGGRYVLELAAPGWTRWWAVEISTD